MTPAELPTIAFIGGGNMAAALVAGLIRDGFCPEKLRIAERDADRRLWLQKEFPGATIVVEAKTAVQSAQAWIIAVKPQHMSQAIGGLNPGSETVVISIAAGITIKSLCRWLGGQPQIIRTMPNTPALVGAGASGLYADDASDQARKIAETVLKAVGVVHWTDSEQQLDAVTAISGSGPAYFFLLTEALQQAGESLGLSSDTARDLARQTLIGAGRLLDSSIDDVTELRRKVTSPGGTTAEAIEHFQRHGLESLVKGATEAAATRAAELANG